MSTDEIQFKSADYTDYADFVLEYANVRERIETVVPETTFLFPRTAGAPKSNLRNLCNLRINTPFISVHLRFVFVI
jgi:hypothetical protein